MAVLRENLPDVRLRVVGTSTSDAYDAVLEKLTASLDLKGVVTLTGWVNSDELETRIPTGLSLLHFERS